MILSLHLEVCMVSFFYDHISHIFSHEILIQSMDSCYLVTCVFQSSTFVDFVRDCLRGVHA